MSYVPPKGAELAVLRILKARFEHRIEALSDSIRNEAKRLADAPLDDEECDYHNQITLDHALKGVRANDQNPVVTLAQVLLCIPHFDQAIQHIDQLLREYALMLDALRKIVAVFEICKDCKGRTGEQSREETEGYSWKVWTDCPTCKGRGVLVANETTAKRLLKEMDFGVYTTIERVHSGRIDAETAPGRARCSRHVEQFAA